MAKTASTDDRAKIQTEIAALQEQLKDSIDGATYAGTNLLKNATTDTSLSVKTSYNRDSAGAVTTGSINVNIGNTRLIGTTAGSGILDKAATGASSILDLKVSGTGAATTNTGFADLLTVIETALKDMTSAATKLGAAKSRSTCRRTSFPS